MLVLALKAVYLFGFKAWAVNTAVDLYHRLPLQRGRKMWSFIEWQRAFVVCDECYRPVMPGDSHTSCDEERTFRAEQDREEALAWQRDQDEYYAGLEAERLAAEAEMDAYLNSRCKQHGCWFDAEIEGFCQSDWDYNFKCDGCGGDRRVCGDCSRDVDDEFHDDEPDDSPEDTNGFYDEARCGDDRPGLVYDDVDEPSAADYMDDFDDDVPSYSEVYGRAFSHFGGNHERAAEAASQHPGDFI